LALAAGTAGAAESGASSDGGAESSQPGLDTIQVEAVPQIDAYTRDGRYRVGRSTFALGGTDALLQETPFSVAPIEKDLFADTDPRQLDGIAPYVPGVQMGNQVNNTSQVFVSRGFQLGRDSILINGTQQSDAFSVTPTEIVSAVEFYRGPASVLSGQAPPGGAANITTKKPLRDAFTTLTGNANEHGKRRAAVDYNSGRAAIGDRSASFRANAVIDDSETFRDHVERDVGVVAPVVTIDLTARTQLTLEANLIDHEATDDRGLPLFGADSDAAAAERYKQSDFILGTTDKQNEREQARVMMDLSHEVSEHITTNFQVSYGETERSFYSVLPAATNSRNGQLVRSHFGTRDQFESLDTRLDSEFEFDTGLLAHSGVVALQFREFERRDEFTTFVAQADQVDPDDPRPDSDYAADGPGRGLEIDQGASELFAQDRAKITSGPLEGLFGIVGARFIDFDDELDNDRDTEETTLRVGGGYTPPAARWFTVYTHYAESFDPQTATTAGGEALPPQEGEQVELGVKANLFNDDLLLTAAVFDIENQNVGVSDPNAPSGSIAVGEQQNQGVELAAVGALSDHLRLRAQYTHNHSEITDDPQREGNELALTPEDSASVWLRRSALPLPGVGGNKLTLAGGLVYVGDRFASVNNGIELSSYSRLDLKARYNVSEATSVELNMQNVTNETYFTGANSYGLGSVYPGQTRTLGLELNHEF